MQHYTKLIVWQRSHKPVLSLYRVTQSFPTSERYELISQLRRAALSVPTNIAEGSKRAAPRDYGHFLNIAEGSLSETEYLVLVSRDLGYISSEAADGYLVELTELMKMLYGMKKTVLTDVPKRKSAIAP